MHLLTSFLLALITALAFAPAPQTQRKPPPQEQKTECGTTISPEQIKAELARRRNAKVSLAQPPITEDVLWLPLTIHMVCDRFGVGGFPSPGQLERTIEVLNQMWRPMNIQFFIYGDIDYSIHNDEYYYLANNDAKQDALRGINSVPNTINVYFANLSGITGQARLTNHKAQGILLDYSAMSEYLGGIWKLEVFAHEMGHYFDLYHTHETVFGVGCPSGINCETTGDRVCDTPADPKLNDPLTRVDNNCVYDNSAPTPAGCDNTPYNPSTRNLMSLARGFCRNEFTPGQVDRVWNTLYTASNRKNLIYGAKFFVDPQASGSNTKCTVDAPCRTVAQAVQASKNNGIIYLKPGVHPVSSVGGKALTFMRWGSSGVAELKP